MKIDQLQISITVGFYRLQKYNTRVVHNNDVEETSCFPLSPVSEISAGKLSMHCGASNFLGDRGAWIKIICDISYSVQNEERLPRMNIHPSSGLPKIVINESDIDIKIITSLANSKAILTSICRRTSSACYSLKHHLILCSKSFTIHKTVPFKDGLELVEEEALVFHSVSRGTVLNHENFSTRAIVEAPPL